MRDSEEKVAGTCPTNPGFTRGKKANRPAKPVW